MYCQPVWSSDVELRDVTNVGCCCSIALIATLPEGWWMRECLCCELELQGFYMDPSTGATCAESGRGKSVVTVAVYNVLDS